MKTLAVIAAIAVVVFAAPRGAWATTPANGGDTTPPYADANGPYVFPAGADFVFDGSASWDDTDPNTNLQFDWSFGLTPSEAIGETPTIPWAIIPAADRVVGPGYDVILTVTDSSGNAATASTTYEVTPEPATMTVLAIGGLGVLVRRRRR